VPSALWSRPHGTRDYNPRPGHSDPDDALKTSRIPLFLGLTATALAGALAAAIAFGGPSQLPAMASINDPFKAVDYSGLPPLSHYAGADGVPLAYRRYDPVGGNPRGSVVLVHGSSANSNSMHVLAAAFAKAGQAAYALDIRGHGTSGHKGHIGYIGQLDDDLKQFIRAVAPPGPVTLAGFSAGGGFVLRAMGHDRAHAFHDCLLLSPFLGQDAPNYRPDSGGWVSVGVPRVVGLTLLNAVGIHALNDLPAARFALNDKARGFLTPEYSFALAANFRPAASHEAALKAVDRPCAVVAGADDEAFDTSKLESLLRAQGKDWPVTLLPGSGHIPLTREPRAVDAAVSALNGLRARP
jgi:non-heme chloroperoxidase